MADLNARREEAEAEHARQLQARLDAERRAAEDERERLMLGSLAAGGSTPRMEGATSLLAYYNAVSSGRWAPHAEVHVVAGTALDGGAAVHLASQAAKDAVAAALEPLIAGMETELRQATKERDTLVEQERPHGLVGWLRR